MEEIEVLWTDLQSRLTALDNEQSTVRRLELSRMAAKKAIDELEDFFASRNEFVDDPLTLGGYNRLHAPRFYAKFIFFSKVSAYECLKADEDARECEELRLSEIAGIQRFFKKHKEFRSYYLSGGTDKDVLYFQNFYLNTIRLDDLVVDISPTVNRGCVLVAYMQAFEEYRSYLTAPIQQEPTLYTDLQWMADPSDLVEVGVALQGYINKGIKPVTLDEIMLMLGTLLHVNLSNHSSLDNKRRNLVNEGPSFLQKLADNNDKRKEDLANNQASRKRRR